MKDSLYLGWKYVIRHRWKTGILVGSLSLILFLPPALALLIERGAANLTSRADATPLLLGAPGSPLELTLNSLYFNRTVVEGLTFGALQSVDPALGNAIPLHARFASRDFPILGTTSDYLEFRGLRLASGRAFALLGECVVGANVARELNLSVGDSVISSPESLFDLAGVYPLKMQIVGLLAPTFSADDDVVLTDLKTAWVIEGLGHGHQDLAGATTPDLVLARGEDSVTANAAVVQYNEITEENRGSFHFHGDNAGYPISGVLVVPRNEKSAALLLGRFLDRDDLQLIQPRQVVDDLLATVFTVQSFVLLILGVVGVATLVTGGLVLALSIRLRARERLTLERMGAARGSVVQVMAFEAVFVLLAGGLIAAALVGATSLIGTTGLLTLVSR